MGLRMSRALGPVESLDKGQWTERTASGLPCVCCHACGFLCDVPEDRMPDRGSDAVRLRWLCPSTACSFSEFIHLSGWLEMEDAA